MTIREKIFLIIFEGILITLASIGYLKYFGVIN